MIQFHAAHFVEDAGVMVDEEPATQKIFVNSQNENGIQSYVPCNERMRTPQEKPETNTKNRHPARAAVAPRSAASLIAKEV